MEGEPQPINAHVGNIRGESDEEMEEFEFESAVMTQGALALRTDPELLMPTDFYKRLSGLRAEIAAVLGNAHSVTQSEIVSIEQRDRVIEAGRLLQAVQKNVAEFYKPIKQAIDQLKQPILEMERFDAESLKTAKDRLGVFIQEFEKRQAQAEAILLEQNRALAAQAAIDGELPPPVIVQAVVPAKTRGKVERTTWSAEVVDFSKLVRAVAAGQVLMMALLPNESWLNKRADSDREGMNIPGVEAHETKKVHFRM